MGSGTATASEEVESMTWWESIRLYWLPYLPLGPLPPTGANYVIGEFKAKRVPYKMSRIGSRYFASARKDWYPIAKEIVKKGWEAEYYG